MPHNATQRSVEIYFRAHASDISEALIGNPAFLIAQRISHQGTRNEFLTSTDLGQMLGTGIE